MQRNIFQTTDFLAYYRCVQKLRLRFAKTQTRYIYTGLPLLKRV